jgi:hypothetical protein
MCSVVLLLSDFLVQLALHNSVITKLTVQKQQEEIYIYRYIFIYIYIYSRIMCTLK